MSFQRQASTSSAAGSGAGELWSKYVSRFSFSQLGWLFNTFEEDREGGVIADMETLAKIIEEWLGHRWPGILQKAKEDFIRLALTGYPLPLDFANFVEFLAVYQEHHIEHEDHAGFDLESVADLQAIYDGHNCTGSGDGLKGKALFSVLEDIGIQFHSKEERQWYVDTVTRFDRDYSGTINFYELCQIIRTVINMEEEKSRKRQFELIQKSGLPFHEVEDWNQLFLSKDEEGKGELSLAEVKNLITGLGVKWDREVSDQIMAWIEESDENYNGNIDFGEFCLVISKMWAHNLHDIRGAARHRMVKDRIVSIRSVHGTYLATNKDGIVSSNRKEAGDCETFVMKRASNGNVCLQSRFGKYMTVTERDVECNGDVGTQFKLATLEDDRSRPQDERVVLTASTPTGGNLFVRPDYSVAVSDGNPADTAYTTFLVVSHEELNKKCWSKALQSKTIAEKKRQSKEACTPRETSDPLSPGMAKAIFDMDEALESKAILSARGEARGIIPGPTPM